MTASWPLVWLRAPGSIEILRKLFPGEIVTPLTEPVKRLELPVIRTPQWDLQLGGRVMAPVSSRANLPDRRSPIAEHRALKQPETMWITTVLAVGPRQRYHVILGRSVLSRRRSWRSRRTGEPALRSGPGRQVLHSSIRSIWALSHQGARRVKEAPGIPQSVAP